MSRKRKMPKIAITTNIAMGKRNIVTMPPKEFMSAEKMPLDTAPEKIPEKVMKAGERAAHAAGLHEIGGDVLSGSGSHAEAEARDKYGEVIAVFEQAHGEYGVIGPLFRSDKADEADGGERVEDEHEGARPALEAAQRHGEAERHWHERAEQGARPPARR